MPRPHSLWPRGRTRKMLLACALATLLGNPSCRSGSTRRDAGPDPVQSCASACAALVRSGCDRDGARPADEARCVAHCVSRAAEARKAGCDKEQSAYLACAAGESLDCSAPCTAALCLERREGIRGCASEHAALERCGAPCAHAGVTTLVDRDAGSTWLKAELVRAGCSPCPAPESRAPAGAPCEAASVCSQVCCGCPGGRARYLARVCLDSACADAERACARVRASGADPCSDAR